MSRSLGRSCGRPPWRRSTDSSCRKTTISSSLELSDHDSRSTICNRQRNVRYPSDQNKKELLEVSGTGRRPYGAIRIYRPRTELTHPTRPGSARAVTRVPAFPRPVFVRPRGTKSSRSPTGLAGFEQGLRQALALA